MRIFRLASSRVAVASCIAFTATAFTLPANAVVEQTDGLVVPIQVANCPGSGNPTGCIQVGLNIGEGLPAASMANPLKAIESATTNPQVFSIPKNNNVYGSIAVVDMIEGAGYENTFGWYNVTAPTQLYPITPCADEPTSTRTVDFQAEFMAGRYLGGFIAFFLITPENAPIGNNCGATGNVGHIYYTEQARNGDGNYVHYLLYQSKVNPLAYYFGFEDLYRGGDNDFEDMFLKVTGLLAPCTPTAEVCDGKDNNCDGIVDNSPTDAGVQCGASNVGKCKFGTKVCQNGTLVCVGEIAPTQEQCNKQDDDCDGVIDNGPAGAGVPCGNNVGQCKLGVMQCSGGVLVCTGGKGPSLEVCNTLDDDCDGVVDDSPVDSGGPCGSNVGACLPGIFACMNGVNVCTGGVPGTMELCNGIDDDCNGAIDDGNPEGGKPCGSNVGACKAGIEYCVGGKITCIGSNGPTAEICDGLDNDCDGVADQLAPCPGNTKCIDGSCAEQCKPGEFPCPGGQICKAGYCVVVSCDNVVCPMGTKCLQGMCIPDGSSGAGGSSSSSGNGGNGQGGGNETGGMGGMNASSSGAAGHGNPNDPWGLATGGGGCGCNVGAKDRNASLAAMIAFAAVVVGRRRNRRNA